MQAGAHQALQFIGSQPGATGTPLSVVYVIDETNNELVAMAWDDAGKKMNYVGYRNIAADSMQARRSGR